jgi:imidazolonepropionase-like amidohydrolase
MHCAGPSKRGLFRHSGIPLDAIFRAATINNARQFKLDRDYGTVAEGKIAKLLLLEANPWKPYAPSVS